MLGLEEFASELERVLILDKGKNEQEFIFKGKDAKFSDR